MRTITFIIFFSVFLTIYGLVNYFIFIRGLQAIPPASRLKLVYTVLFSVFSLSFIVGRFLERAWFCTISDGLIWIGSFWFGAILYFLLIILALDLFRLANHFLHLINFSNLDYARIKLVTFYSAISLVTLTLLAGYINSLNLKVTRLELSIHKKAEVSSMNLVVASDIHLGTIIGNGRFSKIVNTINSLKPDLVLFPGDIVDEDLGPVIKANLGDALLKIHSKYGILASTGNHEYIGGVEPAVKYLEAHGVKVLRDSSLEISGIQIVGREDRNIHEFTGKQRKPLTDLLQQIDLTKPVILLDHQPFHLKEVAAAGIDLQLSGHTHHGQLWPLNYITEAVYEVSRGYKLIGKTHFYVSNGVGTWGPPVRLGSRPEIIQMVLRFEE